MAQLIEFRDVSLTLGGKPLLDSINLPLYDDRKCAMIGINGAGKSTLCRLLTGDEHPDSGSIELSPALRLGYLKQNDGFEPGESCLDFLMRDTGEPDWKCGQLAGRFNIKNEMLNGPIDKLSGGWKTRLKLSALLLHEPNFLLLDEPTNFLDVRTQLLLQRFLSEWRCGALIVSHDRMFLEKTCEHTLELTNGKLHSHPGSVHDYLQKRQERIEQQKRENAARTSKMKQLQTFINKNRAGANTAAQAKNKQKQLERIELHEIEESRYCVNLRLPEPRPLRKTVLECENLTIGYGDNTIASRINLSLEPGRRLIITGDNGQGKTTLLKTITDEIKSLDGGVRWAQNSETGVYAQHVFQSLPPQLTIREYLSSTAPTGTTDRQVLDVAGGFRFSGDDVKKKISVLSGGERARLCLAAIFIRGGNVLILDEPVNHLDVESVQALADALCDYAGTVIFVSHDRSFGMQVATDVIEIRDGRATRFPGTFGDYLNALSEELTTGDNPTAFAGDTRNNKNPEASKDSGKKKYQLEKRAQNIENQMWKLQQKIEPLQKKVHACADWQEAAEIQKSVESLSSEHSALEEEWLNIHCEIERLQVSSAHRKFILE